MPGTAVQWGAWGGSGMAVRTPGFMERMARMGLGIVQPLRGVAVLAQLVQGAWRPLGSPLSQHALFVGEAHLGYASTHTAWMHLGHALNVQCAAVRTCP